MFQFSSLLARTEAERDPRRAKHAAPPAVAAAVEVHPNASLIADELASTSNASVSERVRRDLDEQMQRLADLLDRVESLDVERGGAIDEMLSAVESCTREPAAPHKTDDSPLAVPAELQPNSPNDALGELGERPVLTIEPLAVAASDVMTNEPINRCEVILGNGNATNLADLPPQSGKGAPSGRSRPQPSFAPRRLVQPAARAGTGAPNPPAPATCGIVQRFPASGPVAKCAEAIGCSLQPATVDSDRSSQLPASPPVFPNRDVPIGESVVQTVRADHPVGPSAIGSPATPIVLVEDGPAACLRMSEPASPVNGLVTGASGDLAFPSQQVWDGRSSVETLFQPQPCTARSLGSAAAPVVLVEDPLAAIRIKQADDLRTVDLSADLRAASAFPSRQVWDAGSTVQTLCPVLPRTGSAIGSANPSVVVVNDLPDECNQLPAADAAKQSESWRHGAAALPGTRQLATGRSVVQTVFSAWPDGPPRPDCASTKSEVAAAAPALGGGRLVEQSGVPAVLKESLARRTDDCTREPLARSLPPANDCGANQEVKTAAVKPQVTDSIAEAVAQPRKPLRAMRVAEAVEAAAGSTLDGPKDSTVLNILAALGGLLTLAALVYVAADLASWL